jgi:Flp pilus assembly secretin CpaC
MRALWVVTLAIVSAAPKPEALQLDAGAQKVIDVPEGATARVSDTKVLEVKEIGGKQFLLIGMQPGTAKLEVLGPKSARKAYAVTVMKPDPERVAEEIRRLLGDVPDLMVVAHDCPSISCPKCSAKDQARVDQVAGLYPCVRAVQIVSGAREPEEVLRLARQILGERPGQTEDLELDVLDGRVILRGEIHTEDDAKRVNQVREELPELRFAVRVSPAKKDGG